MTGLKTWWMALTLREKRLIGVMLLLVGVLAMWLGIVRPVTDALVRARADHVIAIDRTGRILAAVEALRDAPKRDVPALDGALDQVIAQSAGEAGFTIDSSNPVGPDRVTIAIGSARANALFAWLGGLEERGIVVETITIQPAANATVSARLLLKVAR